jgi:hypothetical protein
MSFDRSYEPFNLLLTTKYFVVYINLFCCYLTAMIQLPPWQITDLVQITGETLRHWRKVLPPLHGLKGHGRCFILGDVLALTVVKCLVKELGLQVGTLVKVAPRLFEICRTTSWPKLERMTLLIRPEPGLVEVASKGGTNSPRGAFIVVPLRPLMENIRRELLENEPGDAGQIPLRLPPAVVRRAKTGA